MKTKIAVAVAFALLAALALHQGFALVQLKRENRRLLETYVQEAKACRALELENARLKGTR